MRRTFLLLFAGLLMASSAYSQDRVRARHLDGTWQLHVDIDPDEGESALARIALHAVEGLLDEIDVRFEFRKDGDLLILTDAFGDRDEEWSEWNITRRGALLLGDMGPVEQDEDDDTIWMMDDGVLQAYEADDDGRPGKREPMYLARID